MDKLYNYFLHYSPYTKLWAAIPKDKVTLYLSGKRYPHEGSVAIFAEDERMLKQAIADLPDNNIEEEHYAMYGWKNQLNG